jgi:hypothetical protein
MVRASNALSATCRQTHKVNLVLVTPAPALFIDAQRGNQMCEKCAELDRQVEAYQRMRRTTDDPTALTVLSEVIADLQSEKAALHSV